MTFGIDHDRTVEPSRSDGVQDLAQRCIGSHTGYVTPHEIADHVHGPISRSLVARRRVIVLAHRTQDVDAAQDPEQTVAVIHNGQPLDAPLATRGLAAGSVTRISQLGIRPVVRGFRSGHRRLPPTPI